MDVNNNWRPAPGQQAEQPVMDGFPSGDWRSQLQPDSRQLIVNKIVDTLKSHLPFRGPEGLHECKKIAVRFEEKIYTAATSQSDYLRKISLKMLAFESKFQTIMGNALLPNQVPNNGPKTQSHLEMDGNNNWRPAPGHLAEQPFMDGFPGGDWRSQLQPNSRQLIVNKIVDTLKSHLPFSGPEGLHECKKIAVRFEEKIFTAANSQSDYLRKISLKMLAFESKFQTIMGMLYFRTRFPTMAPRPR